MADDRLKSFIDRIATLTEERRGLSADIAEVKKEAEDAGYDVKAIGIVVKRNLETAEAKTKREATEDIADAMMVSLGMLADLPLGRAAREQARGYRPTAAKPGRKAPAAGRKQAAPKRKAANGRGPGGKRAAADNAENVRPIRPPAADNLESAAVAAE